MRNQNRRELLAELLYQIVREKPAHVLAAARAMGGHELNGWLTDQTGPTPEDPMADPAAVAWIVSLDGTPNEKLVAYAKTGIVNMTDRARAAIAEATIGFNALELPDNSRGIRLAAIRAEMWTTHLYHGWNLSSVEEQNNMFAYVARMAAIAPKLPNSSAGYLETLVRALVGAQPQRAGEIYTNMIAFGEMGEQACRYMLNPVIDNNTNINTAKETKNMVIAEVAKAIAARQVITTQIFDMFSYTDQPAAFEMLNSFVGHPERIQCGDRFNCSFKHVTYLHPVGVAIWCVAQTSKRRIVEAAKQAHMAHRFLIAAYAHPRFADALKEVWDDMPMPRNTASWLNSNAAYEFSQIVAVAADNISDKLFSSTIVGMLGMGAARDALGRRGIDVQTEIVEAVKALDINLDLQARIAYEVSGEPADTMLNAALAATYDDAIAHDALVGQLDNRLNSASRRTIRYIANVLGENEGAWKLFDSLLEAADNEASLGELADMAAAAI